MPQKPKANKFILYPASKYTMKGWFRGAAQIEKAYEIEDSGCHK